MTSIHVRVAVAMVHMAAQVVTMTRWHTRCHVCDTRHWCDLFVIQPTIFALDQQYDKIDGHACGCGSSPKRARSNSADDDADNSPLSQLQAQARSAASVGTANELNVPAPIAPVGMFSYDSHGRLIGYAPFMGMPPSNVLNAHGPPLPMGSPAQQFGMPPGPLQILAPGYGIPYAPHGMGMPPL